MFKSLKVKYAVTFLSFVLLGFLLTVIAVATVVPIERVIVPMLIIAAGISFIGCVTVWFMTQRLTSDLEMLSRAAKKLAKGEYDIDVKVKGKGEIAALANEVDSLTKALSELQKTQNTFLGNVAHDLRTPMTSIAGFVDAMLDGVIPPEKERHYLKIISDEVRRLSGLATDVMDLSRISAGERKLVMAPFDICEMLRQILISLEQKIEDKGLKVDFDTDSDRMPVLADSDAIYQVLYNICENAVKFASDGGKLSLSVKRADNTPEGKIRVVVFNEGQGIPKEDIPFVFDRFYRGEKSASGIKGTGLGMFIAKSIIDAHGENIMVKSVYGENCEFTFTLSPINEIPDSKI